MNTTTEKWAIQGATDICIVGNGPGQTPEPEHDRPCVRFNLSGDKPLSPMEIRVSNLRVARLPHESVLFQVLSQGMKDADCERLQYLLTQQALKLKTELGCLPSTGLTTIHTCIELGLSLHILRMPIRATLLRPPDLTPRKPLAAAFHNWLGEQRLAWQLIAAHGDRLRWLDMTAKTHETTGQTRGHLDPYPRIHDWMQVAALRGPNTVDQASLVELVSSSQFDWYGYANQERLRQLEPFLHLDRTSLETPNWWLYSNSLSTSIDTLLRRLSQAQQLLYLEQGAG